MLEFVFEYLTDSYSLLENSINDYIIMAVVGLIAYMIAYQTTSYRFGTE